MPVITQGFADRLDSSRARDFNRPMPADVASAGDLTTSSPASTKVRAASAWPGSRHAGGPDEVVADRVGETRSRPVRRSRPMQGGIAGVDDVLGVLGDRPEAGAQVVIDIGGGRRFRR